MKNAECELTKNQMVILFNSCVKTREETLKVHFKGTWNKLLPNERIVIESVKYNTKVVNAKSESHPLHEFDGHSTVIGGQTNFHKRLDKYVKAKEEGNFEEALDCLNESRWELRFHSNRDKVSGIANRREAEEITLNTYDIPIYTPLRFAPPGTEITPEIQKRVKEVVKMLEEKHKTKHSSNDNSSSAFLQHVSMTVEGFIINIKGYLKQETGKEDFLTEADISLVKSRAQVYLMTESVSNQNLINIGQPIFDRIDKTFYPVQRKEQMKGVIGIMLGYLAQVRQIGIQNISG